MERQAFAITGMDASGYMVRDLERALAFYREILGLEPTIVYPHGKGAEYQLPDGTTFELWSGEGRVEFQPSNGILFAVDDFEAAIAALEARGLPIEMSVETSVCYMATVSDTEGNTVVLHKRKLL